MKSLVTLQQTFNFQTDKFSRHFYLEVYDLFFLPYQHSPANLLEIGIEFGGSIDLWNHYFRNMNIVGMDVEKRDTMPIGDRIHYHFLDAYTPTAIELLRKQYGTFQIIIDDGPHTLESQIFAVEQYSTLINEGLLVIEDIHRDNMTKLLPHVFKLDRKYSLWIYDKQNSRRYNPNYPDDCVLIMEFV